MRVTRSQSGFTLVEIMVVIAVMGVALGLGGGMYMGTYQRMQVEKAARQLVVAARYGRMLALERQGDVRLCFNQQQGRFFLMAPPRPTQGENQVSAVCDQMCKPVELDESISLELVEIESAIADEQTDGETERAVTFRPDGSADAAVVQIGDGKRHFTVAICPVTARVTLTVGMASDRTQTTLDLDAAS